MTFSAIIFSYYLNKIQKITTLSQFLCNFFALYHNKIPKFLQFFALFQPTVVRRRFEIWFSKFAFKVGSRGPCPLGQLVVFEKYSGKSYRGECGCSPGYNQNFWPETGQCYEWYTQGPCKDSFLFQYNRDLGKKSINMYLLMPIVIGT